MCGRSSTRIHTSRHWRWARSHPNIRAARAATGRAERTSKPTAAKRPSSLFPSSNRNKSSTTACAATAQALARANIRTSQHTQNDVVCTNCHSIHGSTTPKFLLAKTQTELCYGCHADVRSQFSMPFKHRVNEGVMTCSDCHNPHGTFAPTWRMADTSAMVEQVHGQRRSLHQVPRRKTRAVRLRASAGSRGRLRDLPRSARIAKFAPAAAASGLHHVPGMPQRRAGLRTHRVREIQFPPSFTICGRRCFRTAPTVTATFTALTPARSS